MSRYPETENIIFDRLVQSIMTKRERAATAFEEKTVEVKWTAKGTDREYTLRYINGDDCTSPVDGFEEWPSLSLPWRLEKREEDEEDEEDEEQETVDCFILGAIWNSDKKLVAVWTHHHDSAELIGKSSYEFVDDLEDVTEALCETICPEMADVFDDGRGTTREVVKVEESLLTNTVLDSFYTIPKDKE